MSIWKQIKNFKLNTAKALHYQSLGKWFNWLGRQKVLSVKKLQTSSETYHIILLHQSTDAQ